MKEWDIWMEGFLATGQEGIPERARCLGTATGYTFLEACRKFMATYPEAGTYYNSRQNTYWACQLYDNEADARKFLE